MFPSNYIFANALLQQRVEPQQAKGEDKPTPSNKNSSNNNSNNSNNDDNAEQKKSMRPSTARRRPPKVKETSAVEAKELSKEKVVKTKIMKEGDKDDAFFDDEDDDNGNNDDNLGSKHVTDAALQGKQHGKLVQNIMNEQVSSLNKKVEIPPLAQKQTNLTCLRLFCHLCAGG